MPSNQECKKFISEIAPLIQKEAKERGYLVCSPVIAQACIESNYGISGLAKYHNYFGLKCGSAWKGKSVNMKTKEEYTVGTLTTIRDNFRVYDSMADGVKGYYDFVSTRRYANLKSAATPQLYLERIKADGYATSSSYVNTNMNCIRKWDLTKWDDHTEGTLTNITNHKSLEEIAAEVIAGEWGVGNDRRQRLTNAGYKYEEIQSIVNKLLKG